jgi:hypothetical protein
MIRVLAVMMPLWAAGCASTAAPAPDVPATPAAAVTPAADAASTVQTRTDREVTVSVEVLTDEAAARRFGVDLAKHGLQAVWMRVRNASAQRLRLLNGAVDADLYSADEVAFVVRGDVRRDEFEALRQRLRDSSMRLLLAPRTVNEGHVFVPRAQGGRYVDVQLHAPGTLYRVGFSVPLPDGDFDYESTDPARIYAGRARPDLDMAGLRSALEQLACCTMDAAGTDQGDPLNVVLVGQPLVALSRAGWSFTHRIDLRSIEREIGAALSGTAYPVAPVSSLYAFGRKQDVAMQRARQTLTRRNHMRLWLAPFRFEGQDVWLGQISRDIGIKITPKSPTLTTHVIDPAIDESRAYLLQSLFTHGLVQRYGFVKGSAAATRTSPRLNLTDDPFFSDGLRLVVVLPEHPVEPAAVQVFPWEEAEGPIASGQSDEARKPEPITDGTAP